MRWKSWWSLGQSRQAHSRGYSSPTWPRDSTASQEYLGVTDQNTLVRRFQKRRKRLLSFTGTKKIYEFLDEKKNIQVHNSKKKRSFHICQKRSCQNISNSMVLQEKNHLGKPSNAWAHALGKLRLHSLGSYNIRMATRRPASKLTTVWKVLKPRKKWDVHYQPRCSLPTSTG